MLAFAEDFHQLALDCTPIIDVRAPVEFAEGALPNSVNLPILEDEERAVVGTTYKQSGSEAAIALGHKLVNGAVKEARVGAWRRWIKQNPHAVITCFRGGMRSGLAQEWLTQVGVETPRVKGGYKAMRRFYLEQLESLPNHSWMVVSGATGAGKTSLLNEVNRPKLDLEKIARHRGSAFGAVSESQPVQATFENELALELVQLANKAPQLPWLIEDESRMIGARVMPENLFLALRISPIVMIDEDLDTRVENTFTEYVLETDLSGKAGEAPAKAKLLEYELAVKKISPKLGGLRTQEILSLLLGARDLADHKIWIRKLLEEYYDPFYFNSIKQRAPQVVFRGSRAEVSEYLRA